MANLADVLQQLREERDRLYAAIMTLTSISDKTAMGRANSRSGRRGFTAAAIAKMRAAQRARRARERGGEKTVPRTSAQRRQISLAARPMRCFPARYRLLTYGTVD
jgi:hypothetical protein